MDLETVWASDGGSSVRVDRRLGLPRGPLGEVLPLLERMMPGADVWLSVRGHDPSAPASTITGSSSQSGRAGIGGWCVPRWADRSAGPWRFSYDVSLPLGEPTDYTVGVLLHELGHVAVGSTISVAEVLEQVRDRDSALTSRAAREAVYLDEVRAWDLGRRLLGPFSDHLSEADFLALRDVCLESYLPGRYGR